MKELLLIRQTSTSRECNICHYWYFSDKGLRFQVDVCNGCHDILMMSMNLSNIAILNFNGADSCLLSTESANVKP